MLEISLTIQMVSRLKKIFGKYLSVYHSKFSNEERFEVWNNVIKTKKKQGLLWVLGPLYFYLFKI